MTIRFGCWKSVGDWLRRSFCATPDHLLIWSVAVDPASQGRGFGRQLLNFAEQEAHRLGFNDIRLYTNEKFTENIRLYQAIGYVITHSESIGERNLVHMQKSIAGRHRT